MLFFCPGEDIVVEKISKVRANIKCEVPLLRSNRCYIYPRIPIPGIFCRVRSLPGNLGRNINSNDVKVLINEDHTIKCQVQDAIGS